MPFQPREFQDVPIVEEHNYITAVEATRIVLECGLVETRKNKHEGKLLGSGLFDGYFGKRQIQVWHIIDPTVPHGWRLAMSLDDFWKIVRSHIVAQEACPQYRRVTVDDVARRLPARPLNLFDMEGKMPDTTSQAAQPQPENRSTTKKKAGGRARYLDKPFAWDGSEEHCRWSNTPIDHDRKNAKKHFCRDRCGAIWAEWLILNGAPPTVESYAAWVAEVLKRDPTTKSVGEIPVLPSPPPTIPAPPPPPFVLPGKDKFPVTDAEKLALMDKCPQAYSNRLETPTEATSDQRELLRSLLSRFKISIEDGFTLHCVREFGITPLRLTRLHFTYFICACQDYIAKYGKKSKNVIDLPPREAV